MCVSPLIFYPYPCKPLADLVDIFRLVPRCFKTDASRRMTPGTQIIRRRPATHSRRGRDHTLSTSFLAADNRLSKSQDVRRAQCNSNHNPSHTDRREHHSDSVLALFAFVIASTKYSLQIDNPRAARWLSANRSARTLHNLMRAGIYTTYCEPLPTRFMSFPLPVPHPPARL